MITPYTIRIRSHLLKLESENSRQGRIHLLRKIIDAGLAAHDSECRELDALNSVHADPQLEAAVCE